MNLSMKCPDVVEQTTSFQQHQHQLVHQLLIRYLHITSQTQLESKITTINCCHVILTHVTLDPKTSLK